MNETSSKERMVGRNVDWSNEWMKEGSIGGTSEWSFKQRKDTTSKEQWRSEATNEERMKVWMLRAMKERMKEATSNERKQELKLGAMKGWKKRKSTVSAVRSAARTVGSATSLLLLRVQSWQHSKIREKGSFAAATNKRDFNNTNLCLKRHKLVK